METQKIIAFFLVVSIAQTLSAQSVIEDRTGFARAQGNIAAGYLFAQKQAAAYVTGDLDIFIKNQISLTGATWFFIPVSRNPYGIKANHSVTWGFNYHFLKSGRADPYVGLTPGLSLVRVAFAGEDGSTQLTPYGIAPIISAQIGCNYYVGSVFNFFIKAQAMAGQFFGDAPQPTPLYELRLTAGLGWNARLWRKKRA